MFFLYVFIIFLGSVLDTQNCPKKNMEIAKHEKIVKQIVTKMGGKVMHPEVRRAREHQPALSLLAVQGLEKLASTVVVHKP